MKFSGWIDRALTEQFVNIFCGDVVVLPEDDIFFNRISDQIRKIVIEQQEPVIEVLPYLWFIESLIQWRADGPAYHFGRILENILDDYVPNRLLNENHKMTFITPDIIKSYISTFPDIQENRQKDLIWGYGAYLTESGNQMTFIREDGAVAMGAVPAQPVNNVGNGQIAGTTADTVPGKKKTLMFDKIMRRRKKRKKSNETSK